MSEVVEAPAGEAEPESLLSIPAAEPAVPSAEPEFVFAEKVLVKGADGAEDWQATARKAEQARQHLEKRLGAGEAPPKDVTGYEFTAPEDLKDFELNTERIDAFKTEALEKGITPGQFKWMMESYLKAAPDLMEGAAKMTAAQAKAELQTVWADALDTKLAAAGKAAAAMPEDLREAAKAYGTDPVVLRVLSWVGEQLGEDKPLTAQPSQAPTGAVNTIMASEAYRNPRHPDHQRVSMQVQQFFASQPGADRPL